MGRCNTDRKGSLVLDPHDESVNKSVSYPE